MNVLGIGHTYVARAGREKWFALASRPNVRVLLIVPEQWQAELFHLRARRQRPVPHCEVLPLRTVFHGLEGKYFYLSPTLHMPSFRPDILHVEEGANACAYFQALWLKRIWAPRAKSVFFTWVNWPRANRFPLTLFEKHNLRHSDGAITGNADAADILRAKGFDRPIRVIPQLGTNPDIYVRTDERALRRSLQLPGFVAAYVGRLTEAKGVDLLLRSAAALGPECGVLVVGDGPRRRALERLARSLRMDGRVRFVGAVPHEQVPRYMSVADVLVLPSFETPRWREQFGQVLVQAMLCGTPVIGSSGGEIPHVIGDAGLIFRQRNVEDLTDKLRLLLSRPAVRRKFAKRGRLRALAHYTPERIAQATYDFYCELLEGG